MFTRRTFLVTLGAASWSLVAEGEETMAGRKINFQIGDAFGDASKADIGAVLRSAAEVIWEHCPNTRWEVPGFFIYHADGPPIVNYAHRPDGRIAIGLNATGRHWAQFAFQFAHEFCHSLAGHSNDWRKPWIRGPKANLWLEESTCETSSLFALRAMGERWKTKAPYPNYRDYNKALTSYAQDRLDAAAKSWDASAGFAKWLAENEPGMRKNATQRELNNVVASQLLPLFEAEPAGWEAVTFCNLGARVPDEPLTAYFADWSTNAPAALRPFVGKVAAVFGIRLPAVGAPPTPPAAR